MAIKVNRNTETGPQPKVVIGSAHYATYNQMRFLRHDPAPWAQFEHEAKAKQRREIIESAIGTAALVAAIAACMFLPLALQGSAA